MDQQIAPPVDREYTAMQYVEFLRRELPIREAINALLKDRPGEIIEDILLAVLFEFLKIEQQTVCMIERNWGEEPEHHAGQ